MSNSYQPYSSEAGDNGLAASKFSNQSDLKEYYEALKELDTHRSSGSGSNRVYSAEKGESDTSLLDHKAPLDRWPTLFEILNKRARSPVDLWSFYVYMRDTQKSIDYLDFWIDTVQHMNLCKVYVKGLKESLIVNEKMRDADIQEGEEIRRNSGSRHGSLSSQKRNSTASSRESRSSSVLLDLLMKNDLFEGQDAHRLSSFLRGEVALRSSDPVVNAKIEELKRRSQLRFDRSDELAQQPLEPGQPHEPAQGPSGEGQGQTEPYERTSKIDPEMVEAFIQEDAAGNGKSFKDMHFVTRATLRRSSQNILNTYFMDGSEKRILIPDDMRQRVAYAIESEGRDDPEVFDESREYVFKAMEHEAYPNFLRDSAMCNVTSRSAVVRMFLAILCAFAAFWTGYTLIFLNYQPKSTRAVVTIPFFFSSYFLFSSFYRVDPLLCFLGLAESRASRGGYIKVKEPFVKRLLWKRSLFVLFLICLLAAAFSVLFALVPGKRLHH
ncbi:DEKNAAC101285 [Brettanomyces naardenensis]|uniref:DEKNAAC101285 n=1 Tax=Brettanomyces naardenensis TaxID=13370 RepID=A0A448YHJ4_BRENA|nr:DEKNAAC101285 [Brettanomyces naardenensis]